jgi:glycosyltransferase involved in cell wall biosynthesis
MRILMIADAVLPVPPVTYGGAERVVNLFGKQFSRMGHTVDLIAAEGSHSFGSRLHRHKAAGASFLSRARRKSQFQLQSLWAARDCDVIYAHGRVDYLRAILKTGLPTLVKFPNPITQQEIEFLEARRRKARRNTNDLALHLISNSQRHQVHTQLPVYVIGNPVDTDYFTYGPGNGGYLLILGRISGMKGVDTAIEIARSSSMPLVIAGNIGSHPEDQEHFDAAIRPHIDGQAVRWTGPVNDLQKRELLQGAKALLFPIRWEEPFGTVMVEALACGTPVIAMRRGAAPEVVDHGRTGMLCDCKEDMVAALKGLDQLNRMACRDQAVNHHDIRVVGPQVMKILETLASAS